MIKITKLNIVVFVAALVVGSVLSSAAPTPLGLMAKISNFRENQVNKRLDYHSGQVQKWKSKAATTKNTRLRQNYEATAQYHENEKARIKSNSFLNLKPEGFRSDSSTHSNVQSLKSLNANEEHSKPQVSTGRNKPKPPSSPLEENDDGDVIGGTEGPTIDREYKQQKRQHKERLRLEMGGRKKYI